MNALQEMEGHSLLKNGVEVLEVLLDHGGDVDQTDEAGKTALHTGVNSFLPLHT